MSVPVCLGLGIPWAGASKAIRPCVLKSLLPIDPRDLNKVLLKAVEGLIARPGMTADNRNASSYTGK